MPTEMKKLVLTNKSSLVQHYKEQGLKLDDIADLTGLSISYIKKLSAKMGKRKTAVACALDKLKKNPYMDIACLELTESQKNMLYRSDIWLIDIKPYRIIQELKFNLKRSKPERLLHLLHPKTKDKLDKLPQWHEVVAARREFEEFKMQLRNFRPLFRQIEETETMMTPYAGEVNLEQLIAIRNSIPREERYTLPKAATGRLMVPDTVAIMFDFKYVQVCHDIRLLENKIGKRKSEHLEKAIAPLCDEAKRMVERYFKIPTSTYVAGIENTLSNFTGNII